MQSRRKFMGQALSVGLGFALGGELVFPNRSEAQFWALADELIEGTMWLGKNLLLPATTSLLSDWVKDKAKTIIQNPKVQTADLMTAKGFHNAFQSPVVYDTASDQQPFESKTRISENTLLGIDDLPRLYRSATSPVASDLNFPEVKEFQNMRNPNLYKENCGCLVRVPVTTGWRERPSADDSALIDAFFDDLNVDHAGVSYVRRFCRCDTGEQLVGLAWKEPVVEGRKFSIISPSDYLA
jgi:hypothetical protein